jgi:hypothetical protein
MGDACPQSMKFDDIVSSNHDYAAVIIAEDKLEGLRCATTLVMTCR